MLHIPILSGRLGKWGYSLLEYDLAYAPLKSMKGQTVDDFIVEHRVDLEHDLEVNHIFLTHGSYILMDRLAMRVNA